MKKEVKPIILKKDFDFFTKLIKLNTKKTEKKETLPNVKSQPFSFQKGIEKNAPVKISLKEINLSNDLTLNSNQKDILVLKENA